MPTSPIRAILLCCVLSTPVLSTPVFADDPGSTGTVTVNSGTTLTFNAPTDTTYPRDIINHGTVEGATGDGITVNLTGAISGDGRFLQTGTGTSILSGSNSYSGGTTISAGRLSVDGSLTGDVNVSQNAELGGHGTIAGTIRANLPSGDGAVGPGNSPGILTAEAVEIAPFNGMSFNFEFTQSGAPTWSQAGESGNDVLHLTGETPFIGTLDFSNYINFYFTADNTTYLGGFFVDGEVDSLTSSISEANLRYYLLNNVDGDFEYNGNHYDLSNGTHTIVPATGADFAGGTVDGFTERLEVGVVPEPGTWALLIGGLSLLTFSFLRNRARN